MASSSLKASTNRRLNILCCSGSLEGGGSERQLWQLASKLDRVRFLPSVYLLYQRGPYLEHLPADVHVTAFWNEYDESRRWWPGQIRRWQIDHLTRVIRERAIDVVYDRTFHMTLVSGAAAQKAGVPRISVIVSPPSLDFQQSRERFRYLKKWLLAAAYRRAGCATVAVSEEVADDAAAFYKLDRSQIIVLPNPVDVEAVRSASAGSGCPSTHGSTRIAVVGRLSHEKGQRLALEALQLASLERATSIFLDFVGEGPDRAELEALADRMGIHKQVTFHGFLSNPFPLVRAADLLCIPSAYEGLPNVALEAMTLGTGVVATACSGSLRSLIGANERGVLVGQGDARALAREFVARRQANTSMLWEGRCRAASQWVEVHHALTPWLASISHNFLQMSQARQF